MARSNVTLVKLQGGLGRRLPNTDGVCGLISSGVAAGTLALNTTYTLKGIEDLEALGITSAYDTTNDVLLYHHVSRFFLRNPSGELWLRVVAQTVTMTQMVTKTLTHAKQLLQDANGKIRMLGVNRNPAAAYSPTLATGLDADVVAAIPAAQALVDEEFDEFRLLDAVILEGRSYNGLPSAALDLRAQDASNVHVTIAADPAISASGTLSVGYAAVGDVLGIASLAAISQNIGERAPEFNLQNVAESMFLTAGLSSNALIGTYTSAQLDTLHDKGYIFPEQVAGLDGFFLNDSHSATPIDGDYAYLENNRVIDKALRLARLALLPNVNSRLLVESGTGKLSAADKSRLEDLATGAVEPMFVDGDISGPADCWIDPEQDLLSTSELIVQLKIVPVAIGRAIVLKVGFTNPLKA
jgi:hypothetical protein